MTNFRFTRPIFAVGLTLSLLALGGCGSSPRSSNLQPNSGNPFRGVAASFLAGRAFDRAEVALQRDDSAGLQRAGIELRRASNAGYSPRLSGAFAANLSLEATRLALSADAARGEEMIDLLTNSAGKYRAALAFVPEKSPEKMLDAQTLNSLGYFLADRGTTQADFERAVLLTRAAYRTWPMNARTFNADALNRAQLAQDSMAWALFKLGKLDEARHHEEQVWDLSRGMGAAGLTGEIPFHLAEIYRALGLKDKARDAYRQAVILPLDSRTKAKIEGAIRILDASQV